MSQALLAAMPKPRHPRRRFLRWVAVVAFLWLGASPANACQCKVTTTMEEDFNEASAVVLGRVQSIIAEGNAQQPSRQKATWVVVKSWKGQRQVGSTFLTDSKTDPWRCGQVVTKGTDYFMFLYGDGPYSTSVCGNTYEARQRPELGGELSRIARKLGAPPGRAAGSRS